MLYPKYKIILKYYQADVLESTYTTQRIISNEKDLQFSFARNMQFEGAFQEFSDTFIFIKEDRQWIIDKRDDYLSRKDRGTYIQLEFYKLNRSDVDYDLEYTGKLKIPDTEIPKLYIECEFEVDSALNRLDSIQDETVTIEKDGMSYDYDISLTAVYDALAYVGEWDDWRWNTVSDSPESYPEAKISTPIQIGLPITSESDKKVYDFFNTGAIYFKDDAVIIFDNPRVDIDISSFPSTYFLNKTCILEIETYITIKYDPEDNSTWENKSIISYANTNFTPTVNNFTIEDYDVEVEVEASKLVFDENNNIKSVVDFVKAQSFRLINYNGLETTDTYIQEDGFIYNMGEARLTFGGSKTSQIVAHPLREILDDYETLQGVTINTDALDGTIYDTNDVLLTTSRGIKGITPLNYNFSFKDWFNSSKAFQALSLDYVGDTIYILPILDAYDDSEIIDLPDAVSVVRRSNELNINNLTIGNSGGASSNFDYGDLDPIASADYSFGLETEQEKVFSNKIRVDGSTINKAAIDFEKVTVSIEDRDDDKDLYFIARDPSESKIVSNFTKVSGLDFDKFGQFINGEYDKMRQLYNWRNYYGHLFTGYSELQLKSWNKNKDIVYTDPDRGVDIVGTPETIDGVKSFNGAYGSFDGTTYTSSDPILNAPFSIYLKFRTPDVTIPMWVASQYEGGVAGRTVFAGFFDTTGVLKLFNNGGIGFVNIGSVSNNVDIELCLSFNGSTVVIYLDKTYIGAYQYIHPLIDDFIIGGGTDSGVITSAWIGDVLAVKVFSKALSSEESIIADELYGDIQDINFEYTNLTTLYDSSGNDNHSTINGTLSGFIQEDASIESSRDRDGYGEYLGAKVPRLNTESNIALPKQQQLDIFGNKLVSIGSGGIFGNNLYICEIPQKSGTYNLIKANKNKRFRTKCNGTYYTGYLKSVTLSPLTRELMEVELIESAQ